MAVWCGLKIPSRASRGLLSNAEQLSRATEFLINTDQPLWILVRKSRPGSEFQTRTIKGRFHA